MSMSRDDHASARSFLHRWSARKHAAVREAAPPSAEAPPSLSPEPAAAVGSNVRAAAPAPAPLEAEPLPPVESLSFDSDFTAFMRTEVDETTRRSALRKLFSDPRFNVMDGLDVYIDDYSKPDPIAPEVVRQLVQARFLFNPPKTRINEEGVVEDVPVTPSAEVDAASRPAEVQESMASLPEAAEGLADTAPPSNPHASGQLDPVPGVPSSAAPEGTAQPQIDFRIIGRECERLL